MTKKQNNAKNKAATAALPKVRTMVDYIWLAARGFCMGAADVVPGVSGGTMAFILGIYEELIDSIRMVGQPEFLKLVFGFRIREIFQTLNWKFLLAVLAGIATAVLTLAPVIETLLETQPVYLWSFFFGLVLASIITVRTRVKAWDGTKYVAVVLGTVGAYLLVGMVPAQTPNTWWFLILSGMVAICAMILPGISGSFVLVLMGKYQYVLAAVNDRDLVTVALVGIGAVVGLVTIAQALGWLFKNYHDITVAVLIGLMVGSLRKVWPWKTAVAWLQDATGTFILSGGHKIITEEHNYLPNLTQNGFTQIAVAVGLMLVAIVLVIVLERLANKEQQTA